MKRATGILFLFFAIVLVSGYLASTLAAPSIIQTKLAPDTPVAGEEVALPEVAERARDVRMRHAPLLMEMPEVVGVGLSLSARNRPAILVLLKSSVDLGLIPHHIEGVPIIRLVTGRIHAMPSLKEKIPAQEGEATIPCGHFPRPVPIGVSTGNIGECSSGTLGVRVIKDSKLYVLSNNHVFALENEATAGGKIVQPGVYDSGSCQQKDENAIAVLQDFVRIDFGTDAVNRVDAAIASTTNAEIAKSTPQDGYGMPSSNPIFLTPDDLLMPVQKYGRTTGLTQGVVEAIDMTVDVSYDSRVARFTNQIMVSSRKEFIKAGDSGSLLVTVEGKEPAGLIFAGSTTGRYAFANPIGVVLDVFGIEIDGEP